ncbi:MAG: Gram-negative bacterial TonB protein C-terminal [Acidobacteriota bacterium]
MIIDGIISSSGCFVAAKIRRSVAIPLDLAALQAVLDWRFSPALLEAKPVPVMVTVTVFFRFDEVLQPLAACSLYKSPAEIREAIHNLNSALLQLPSDRGN